MMISIYESTVLDLPIETLWRQLRDFNSHRLWHPAIADSEIEAPGAPDAIGAVRRFRLSDGGVLREQLIALSDRDHTLRYTLLDAPLPLFGYVAMIRLRAVTMSEATLWEWSSRFDPPSDQREALARLVRDEIYRAGFVALRDYLTSPERVR